MRLHMECVYIILFLLITRSFNIPIFSINKLNSKYFSLENKNFKNNIRRSKVNSKNIVPTLKENGLLFDELIFIELDKFINNIKSKHFNEWGKLGPVLGK
uniref:Uncharacterized protein n=1 Tax=Strongyloides stercoralis TaxID=6248 RepID=A0A0K0EIR2_STRER